VTAGEAGVPLGGLRLPNPVMVAAGCGGTGRELATYTPLDRIGAFVTRSVTRDARPGPPAPRLAESSSGLLHATGLVNPGLQHFLAVELPWLVQAGARVVVSVSGADLGEYADLGRRLAHAPGVAAVEVNATSAEEPPGLLAAREPFHAASVVGAVRRDLPAAVPVLAKLRPDLTRVVEAARAVADAGAAAVVVGGALPAALPGGRAAGLGGPAVLPVALRCVHELRERLDLGPVAVIGGGGVRDADDARSFLAAGAHAVQIGTALLHDPTTLARIVADLEEHP
jgi:dihydroorotate dehydrogenase (NAD+) catalytic subunit